MLTNTSRHQPQPGRKGQSSPHEKYFASILCWLSKYEHCNRQRLSCASPHGWVHRLVWGSTHFLNMKCKLRLLASRSRQTQQRKDRLDYSSLPLPVHNDAVCTKKPARHPPKSSVHYPILCEMSVTSRQLRQYRRLLEKCQAWSRLSSTCSDATERCWGETRTKEVLIFAERLTILVTPSVLETSRYRNQQLTLSKNCKTQQFRQNYDRSLDCVTCSDN